MNHGVTFHFGSAKMYSLAIFETCFSYEKDIHCIWIAASYYYNYVLLHNCAISIDT